MATKGERSALLFLATVALLGAGTRLYRSRDVVVDSSNLDRQIAAVETSRGTGRPRSLASRRSARPRPAPDRAPAPSATPQPAVERRGRIDVDIAAVAEIETLPGIGPSLAKRIVADREAGGAFGCLRALDTVKGIGPAILGRLDSLVSFSGPPRPSCGQR